MTFDEWMFYKELSSSSVRKYGGPVRGVISNWATANNLLAGPLTSLDSRSAFDAIDTRLRALPIFKERDERGHHMYSSALSQFAKYLSEGFDSNIELDIDLILAEVNVGATEKSNLVKARIGQGAFRQKLIAYWNGCAITKVEDTSLLIASHIKPWRASTNAERLDPFNGLLLVPNLDRAFDTGYVSFDSLVKILISPLLYGPEKLGILPEMWVALTERHQLFLEFHRVEVIRAG